MAKVALLGMEKSELLEQVKAIIADEMGLDVIQVAADAKLADDLGVDSLDLVSIIMSCETEFSITVSDEEEEEWARLETPEAITDHLLQKYGSAGASD